MKRWALSVGVGLLVVCGSFAEAPAKSPKGKILLVVAATAFSTEQYQSIRQGLEKSGYEINVASSKKQTTGVPEYKLDADVLLSDVENLKPYLGIIFCGGPGIVEYQGLAAPSNSDKPKPIAWKLVGEAVQDKKVVGAICQAPAFVLAPTGVLKGKRVTGWGGKEERDAYRKAGALYSGSNLEVDRKVITAKGEGLKLFISALQKELGSQRQALPTPTTTNRVVGSNVTGQ